MEPPSQYLFKTFDLEIAGYTIKPEYWHAGVIVLLVFMILLAFARYRHQKVKWGLQGFIPTVLLGFVLAIFLEIGLLLSGKTLMTEVLGWENAPKPISAIIDTGRTRMVQVLGETDMSVLNGDANSVGDEIILLYTSLEQDEADKVKDIICKE